MLSRLFHILLAVVAIGSVVTAAPRGAWAEAASLDMTSTEFSETCDAFGMELDDCFASIAELGTTLGVRITDTASPTSSPVATAPVRQVAGESTSDTSQID